MDGAPARSVEDEVEGAGQGEEAGKVQRFIGLGRDVGFGSFRGLGEGGVREEAGAGGEEEEQEEDD